MATRPSADSEKAPDAPPNLRVAEDESQECDSCTYFDRGHCTAFPPLCVDGEWVCDHYKKGNPRTLEAASDEALVRIRAHTRRKAS